MIYNVYDKQGKMHISTRYLDVASDFAIHLGKDFEYIECIEEKPSPRFGILKRKEHTND